MIVFLLFFFYVLCELLKVHVPCDRKGNPCVGVQRVAGTPGSFEYPVAYRIILWTLYFVLVQHRKGDETRNNIIYYLTVYTFFIVIVIIIIVGSCGQHCRFF
jgi:hypothetical protein